MTVTYEKLEEAFAATIEKNRRGQTMQPCDREDLSRHAFFYMNDEEPDQISFLPAGLPFERFWVVTEYKGLAIIALIEPMPGFDNLPRPDYLWYPAAIPGERIRTTEAEMDETASFIVDRALHALQRNHLQEVASPVQAGINRGRAKTVGKPSFIPDLPPFIRVLRELPEPSAPLGGTHASPVPHDRRGHWRTYKASGKRVWINDQKVNGGSSVPRAYRVA